MANFRKRPVVIEAKQYFTLGITPGVCYCNEEDAHIHTLEGVMHVSDGDWIIKGVKGEYYPCKPDIFEMTYEKVD